MLSLVEIKARVIDALDHGDANVSLTYVQANDMIAEIHRLRSLVEIASKRSGALGNLARAYFVVDYVPTFVTKTKLSG